MTAGHKVLTLSGEVSPEEVSRTMHLLEREGLAENFGGEGVANERWRLTPYGEAIAPLVREYEERLQSDRSSGGAA
jgi:hypothetical protein